MVKARRYGMGAYRKSLGEHMWKTFGLTLEHFDRMNKWDQQTHMNLHDRMREKSEAQKMVDRAYKRNPWEGVWKLFIITVGLWMAAFLLAGIMDLGW